MIPADLLTGTRVLVAGGAGHVGGVMVDSLLRAGATVTVPSRSRERLDALTARVQEGRAERLVPLIGDIADESDGARVRDVARREMGGIDAVIASMGGFVMAPSVLDTPTDSLRRALDNYVVAHHRVARNLIPALRETGGSYTFINGFLAFGPTFRGAGLIATATAAQAMLARVLMQELEATSVRVNEVVLYTSFGRARRSVSTRRMRRPSRAPAWASSVARVGATGARKPVTVRMVDDDERNRGGVGKEDVGRFIVQLVSARGAAIRGQTIHLNSLDVETELLSAAV